MLRVIEAVGRFVVWAIACGVKLYFEFHGMPAPVIVEHFARRDVQDEPFH